MVIILNHKIKRAECKPQHSVTISTHIIVREDTAFNRLLHADAACKLLVILSSIYPTLHVQCKKLGFSLVRLHGETERPFNPPRVLLGAFLLILVTSSRTFMSKFFLR